MSCRFGWGSFAAIRHVFGGSTFRQLERFYRHYRVGPTPQAVRNSPLPPPRAPSCRRRPPSPRAAPPRVSLLVGLHVLNGKFILQAGDSERGYPATVGKFCRSPASHAVRSMIHSDSQSTPSAHPLRCKNLRLRGRLRLYSVSYYALGT